MVITHKDAILKLNTDINNSILKCSSIHSQNVHYINEMEKQKHSYPYDKVTGSVSMCLSVPKDFTNR